MTTADKPAFLRALNRLAVALREADVDAIKLLVYFDALKDLEIEFLVAAAERLAQTATWFPKVPEWRAMAATIERERIDAQRAVLRKLRAPLCLACDDTGWDRTDDDRVHRCSCVALRRLEILGRRPMPSFPEEATP